jgi:hypothetical protein
MDALTQAADLIIHEQQGIIGPLAVEQARKVAGLEIDKDGHAIGFKGDKNQAISDLVEQYRALFGQTSVEVCKRAVQNVIAKMPPAEVPDVLR